MTYAESLLSKYNVVARYNKDGTRCIILDRDLPKTPEEKKRADADVARVVMRILMDEQRKKAE